jgi:hypothetical protein
MCAYSLQGPAELRGSCESLRTSPISAVALSGPHCALSGPFFFRPPPPSNTRRPENRKCAHYKSMPYSRTSQAVGLHHCLGAGVNCLPEANRRCRGGRPRLSSRARSFELSGLVSPCCLALSDRLRLASSWREALLQVTGWVEVLR